MKKFLLISVLFMSLLSMDVNAQGTNPVKPENLSIEQKNNRYEIAFKGNIKEGSKAEIDVSSNKKDWTGSNGKLIVKDIVNDSSRNKISVSAEELKNTLNKDSSSYSIRVRVADGKNKSVFSSPVTVGTIGIYKNSSSWAEKELMEAQKMGLISDSLKSDMKKNISREEFAELLVKAAQKGNIATSHINTKIFKDTNNSYVSNACSLNYMNGTSENTFSPKAEITKQDMAVAIYRMLSDVNKTNDKKAEIKDGDKISQYAVPAVNSLVSSNVFTLNKNGEFNPKNRVTREEAVILVLRALNVQ